VDEACGGATRAGHDPSWKRAIHHDAGRSWDMDDVRDFYVRELFGVDPLLGRYVDPERMLDLGRATNAEMVSHVFTEWRRPGSECSGGLVMAFNDLVPGAGWGLIDSFARPKATWFALRRVCAPLAVLLTDEGLNGLRVHLLNDTAHDCAGILSIDVYADGEHRVDRAETVVTIPARGGLTLDAETLLDGFRDLSYAYRFGPPAHDVVSASLFVPDGSQIAHAAHLIGGQSRPFEPDVGLSATVRPAGDGWNLDVATRRFAQWVSIEAGDAVPEDSWFHLPPGTSRSIRLATPPDGGPPSGTVRALNSMRPAPLRLADDAKP